ncbi:MAG: glycosyltransferase [Bacteroides uniformis]|nr:glycosyltransferase [Bacteroides uniformis]
MYRQENEGLPLARKTGILKANGKYIQHLDSDDTLIDGAIEKLVCRAEETDADIVASSFLLLSGQGACSFRALYIR